MISDSTREYLKMEKQLYNSMLSYVSILLHKLKLYNVKENQQNLPNIFHTFLVIQYV